MELLFGILIMIALVGLVFFAFKGGNLVFGILCTATIWWVLAYIGFRSGLCSTEFMAANAEAAAKPLGAVIMDIYQKGIEAYGPNMMNVIFGAWFGTVMMETGVAAALIRRTVELGGDRPAVSACLLCCVVAGIFTSVFGIGAVIAIGVIVLPILLSLGISKLTATISYLFAVGAGLFVNPTLSNTSLALFCRDANGTQIYFFDEYVRSFGWIAMLVALAFTIVLTYISITRENRVHAWAAQANPGDGEERHVPSIALLAPILPALSVIFLGAPIIPTFIAIGFVIFALCGRLSSLRAAGDVLSKTLYNAIVDSAALIGYLTIMNLIPFSLGYARPFIVIVLEPVVPRSDLVLAISMAVLAPLALFRGPLTIFGAGGAIMMIVYSLGFTTYNFLFPLFWIPSMCINLMACITQSYVIWAIGYTKLEPTKYMKRAVPMGWIMAAILTFICYALLGNSGIV